MWRNNNNNKKTADTGRQEAHVVLLLHFIRQQRSGCSAALGPGNARPACARHFSGGRRASCRPHSPRTRRVTAALVLIKSLRHKQEPAKYKLNWQALNAEKNPAILVSLFFNPKPANIKEAHLDRSCKWNGLFFWWKQKHTILTQINLSWVVQPFI